MSLPAIAAILAVWIVVIPAAVLGGAWLRIRWEARLQRRQRTWRDLDG